MEARSMHGCSRVAEICYQAQFLQSILFVCFLLISGFATAQISIRNELEIPFKLTLSCADGAKKVSLLYNWSDSLARLPVATIQLESTEVFCKCKSLRIALSDEEDHVKTSFLVSDYFNYTRQGFVADDYSNPLNNYVVCFKVLFWWESPCSSACGVILYNQETHVITLRKPTAPYCNCP